MKYELRAENPTFGTKVIRQGDSVHELVAIGRAMAEKDRNTTFAVVNLETERLSVRSH